MKNLKDIISEKLVINKHSKIKQEYNYYPKTKIELKKIIKTLIEERGDNADLNDIDTSNITDMSELFYESEFNGDISKWDVSNVKDMGAIFSESTFDGDISKWNVRKVENMFCMFYGSKFTGKNGNISDWDVSNVEDMSYMFDCSPLEKNPPKWYKK